MNDLFEEQRATGGAAQFYPTPPALCAAVCETLANWRPVSPRNIVEPSAGTGNFVRAARRQWPDSRITAIDIVDERETWGSLGADGIVADWEKVADTWKRDGVTVDLVLGNPSFPLAVPHIKASLSVLAPGGILAFVLRLSFEEWTKALPYPRAAFWLKHPLRARGPIAQRPSFTGKGTDSAGVALFVWEKDWSGRGELLPPISWR